MLQLTSRASYKKVTVSKNEFTGGIQSMSYKLLRIRNACGFVGSLGKVNELKSDAILFVSTGMHLNLAVNRATEEHIEFDVIDMTKSYLQDVMACIRRRSISKLTMSRVHSEHEYLHQTPSEKVTRLFDCLECQVNTGGSLQEAIFDAVIFRLMVELYQNSLILDILELEDHKNIIDCISEAISNDLERKWKVEDLAKALNMSKPTLQRKLKETGSDFSQTINTCRLHQARKLLMYTDYSVSQIAMKCGFDSHAYFSSLFKKRYGTTPREFKNYVTFSTYR